MRKFIAGFFDSLYGDKYIWLSVLLLMLFSLLAVYSASNWIAMKEKLSTTNILLSQIGFSVAAALIMYVAHLIDFRYYSRIAQLLLIISIPLLIYTLFFGVEINHAKRWMRIPGINLIFQTSELAKVALIMFLARQLSLKQDTIKSWRDAFVPIMMPVMIVVMLIAPANLSTALILFFTSVFIMFIGRIPLRYIGMIFGIGAITVMLLVSLLFVLPDNMMAGRMKTWKARIENYTSGKEDKKDAYQVMQAKIAIAKGGIIPNGPGNSKQKNFLPSSHADFIYAIIIEEYGLLGGMALVFIYLFFMYRCIRIVLRVQNPFGALLAVGLGFSMVIQALINMGVAVNLLPVTGVTLPLVSKGGTSVFFTALAFGIILSVSRSAEESADEAAV